MSRDSFVRQLARGIIELQNVFGQFRREIHQLFQPNPETVPAVSFGNNGCNACSWILTVCSLFIQIDV